MSERNKQHWIAYGWSIATAGLISLVFLPALVSAGWIDALLMSLVATLAFGTCFFLLGALRELIRLPTFLLNLLVQTVLLAVTIILPSILISWIAITAYSKRSPFDSGVLQALESRLNPGAHLTDINLTIGGLLIVSALVSLVINGAFQISRKIGPGMFGHWITGRYYNPREEERIFMFLDMKDSTRLGEELGNLQFSALVRDFFHDLTLPVLETKGEVSHFIGDEVVLSWKPAPGLAKSNCIQAFFKMKDSIQARAAYYSETYGLIPEFKAGVHIGKVVATEVGEIKSEIVFHGDVLNTAARIQALCNSEDKPLLISGDLADRLGAEFDIVSLGPRSLKGKAHDVSVCAVLGPPGT